MDLFTILILLLFFLWPVLEAMSQKRKERERIEEMRREEEAEAAEGGGEWAPPSTPPAQRRAEEERSFLDEIEERARASERRPDVWTPAPRGEPRRERRPSRPEAAPSPRPAPRPEPSLESFTAPDEREIERYRRKLAAPRAALQVEAVGAGARPGARIRVAPNLRNADRVAEAIVLGEILGPPRALRSLEER